MKLGIYIMASELISKAYIINPSNQSVCMCIPLIVATQQLRVFFYVIQIASEESRRLFLPRTSCPIIKLMEIRYNLIASSTIIHCVRNDYRPENHL
jgi:hypothetical protein